MVRIERQQKSLTPSCRESLSDRHVIKALRTGLSESEFFPIGPRDADFGAWQQGDIEVSDQLVRVDAWCRVDARGASYPGNDLAWIGAGGAQLG